MTDTSGRRYHIVPNTPALAPSARRRRPRPVRGLLCFVFRHRPEAMWFVADRGPVVRLGCVRCRRPLRWALG